MKIFELNGRSQINYLLPLIAIAGDLRSAWKTIKSTLFNNVLDHATFPKESADACKAGFYHIIIRPAIKMIEINEVLIGDTEQTAYLKSAIKKSLMIWNELN